MKLCCVNATRNFIRKRAGSNILTAVDKADLNIEEGKITALFGPSGSGKSTLLNMLAGLLPPTSGKVLADGADLYAMEDKQLSAFRNEHFGIIPQGQTAIMSLNVLENVMMPFYLYNHSKGDKYQETLAYAMDLLERAGIRELENEMPSELSGGEIRRMAVCRAMIMKPQIILADEPTGDLDEENTRIVLEMLREHAAGSKAAFVVTHDSQVRNYSDINMQMAKGVCC